MLVLCWCCVLCPGWLAGGRGRVPEQCSVASRAVKGQGQGQCAEDGDEDEDEHYHHNRKPESSDHTPQAHTTHTHTPCTTHPPHYTPQVRSFTHTHTRTRLRRFHGPSQSNPGGFVLSRSRPAVDRALGQSRTSSICKLAAQAEAAKAGANQDGLGLRGGGVWRRHTGRNAGGGQRGRV